ncbi:MAG TPA: hypothetical protein VGX91_03820 [Candidatus Cybelea sp.]|jgi:hypothetical protein|nr:hypothetical protein [Candidatus Cybelea sp.]
MKILLGLSLATLTLLVIAFPLPIRADGTQIEGVTITAADITQLLTALHKALKPNDSTIPIMVSLKSSSEMPAYDPQWHYAGIQEQSNGVKAMSVWIDSGLKGTDQQNAIEASFLLALTDGGYGGKAFKQLYDIYAAKDAQLPPSSPDPALNRQKYAAALVNMLHLGS